MLAVSAAAAAQAPKTCEQCFTSILSQDQITRLEQTGNTSVAALCAALTAGIESEVGLRTLLFNVGITGDTQDEIIACLIQAGIVFT